MAAFTFTPLTPICFLERSALVFADRVAVVDGGRSYTYAVFLDRCRRLAGALHGLGVRPGDRVAALCTNSHVMLELHNAVPYAAAVLVPLNIRLSPREVRGILEHSGASVLVTTEELAEQAREATAGSAVRLVVDTGADGEYEQLLQAGEPAARPVLDERGLLAISYTSGTTGGPKGVMYHHRGGYLQALAMAYHARLDAESRYLWTLPQFHCDGWTFTWAVTAAGGRHICLRSIDPHTIWQIIASEGVTHLSGAPTVLTMIGESSAAHDARPAQEIQVSTGGAPPTPALLERLAGLRMHVTHLYGLTETYGPIAINDWHTEWDALTDREKARLNARQGVGNITSDPLRVVDSDGHDVPADGTTVGEIVCRGNDVMLGYYRDDAGTANATVDGWFRTGDLGVMHPDRYVEVTDRAKDIIISGGENIASVEVERALAMHPDVVEAAVVGEPDQRWGETPVAFVTVRNGAQVSAEDLQKFLRGDLAGFKVPRRFVFGDLPKTSTGKIQKTQLRAGLRRV